MKTMTLTSAMTDPAVLGRQFAGSSWSAWRAFLRALFGEPMSPQQQALYRRCTTRKAPPSQPVREGWIIAGRRGGKSIIAALVAVYLATFRDYRSHLGPGEVATVMIIAADRRQARVIMRYVTGLLECRCSVPWSGSASRSPSS